MKRTQAGSEIKARTPIIQDLQTTTHDKQTLPRIELPTENLPTTSSSAAEPNQQVPKRN